MIWLFAALAVLAGALIPLQAGVNASLRAAVANPIFAAVVNFTVGGALIVAYAFASRMDWPSGAVLARVPWWCFVGGAMGACLVLSGVLFSHRLGAASFMACIIVGQLTSSLVLDHFGWVGFQQHAVTWPRLAGIGFLALGAYLVRMF